MSDKADLKGTDKQATALSCRLFLNKACDIDDEVVGIRKGSGEELKYISDFNRDGNRNIKDATAIQKYLAKI